MPLVYKNVMKDCKQYANKFDNISFSYQKNPAKYGVTSDVAMVWVSNTPVVGVGPDSCYVSSFGSFLCLMKF